MRLKSLDVLRDIAVLLVIGHHAPECPEETPLFLRAFLHHWMRIGWIGVDIFFVLSGFLVSGLLFREYQKHGKLRIGRFLVRRGLKIYPAFYFMLLVTFFIRLLTARDLKLANFASECLFVQNYFTGIHGHTWTLAVEEHFYIALSLLLGFIVNKRVSTGKLDKLSSIPQIYMLVGAVVLGLRCLTFGFLEYDMHTHLFPTHLRIDGLFFGVVLSYVYHFHSEMLQSVTQRFRFPLLAFSVLLVSPVAFDLLNRSSPWFGTFGLTLLYIGFGIILICTVDWAPRSVRLLKLLTTPLSMMGVFSYSIYLWHLPVKHWVQEAFTIASGEPLGYWIHMPIYCIGSIVGGVCLAKAIEIPVLRLRDKLAPSLS